VPFVTSSTLSAPDRATAAAPQGETSRSERDRRSVELLRRARLADGPERALLEDRVVRLNMALARQLSSRYRGRGITLDDLHQVAYMGLVKAVHGFQPEKGSEFLGYAIPTIRGEIRKHFRDAGWTVRPPRRIQELQARIWAAESELTQELHRSPTPREIAGVLEVETQDVIEALSADGCFSPSSLDAPSADGDARRALSELQGGPDLGFDRCEARVMLAPAVRRLGERDRKIIELRFFRGWTQQQIGDEIGVTQMQISRLISRILGDLRAAIAGEAA
jgi:RNA polymerase sigma-B factor